MRKRFVLLEITDPEISGLLLALRMIFTGKKQPLTNIHLTVRGPYRRKIQETSLRKWSDALAGDVLRIEGAEIFVSSKKL